MALVNTYPRRYADAQHTQAAMANPECLGIFEATDFHGLVCIFEVWRSPGIVGAHTERLWSEFLEMYNMVAASPADGDEIYYLDQAPDELQAWMDDRIHRVGLNLSAALARLDQFIRERDG